MQIGTDIIEIERITQVLERQPRFAERVLSEEELALYETMSSVRQNTFLAGRFSAKEAYGKALGTGVGTKLKFTDITILPNDLGVPIITKAPVAHPTAKISISHSKHYATATVIMSIDDGKCEQIVAEMTNP